MTPSGGKKEGLILKLDFEKAYDKINWNFILECLAQRGLVEEKRRSDTKTRF
jgi:hypothetical protein